MARFRFLLGPLFFLTMAGNVPAQAPTSTAATLAKVDYANDVRPILQENCTSCHGPLKQRGGMRLDRKSSATKNFSRRIVPGGSENSRVYRRIKGELGSPMPPDGELKADQIATIKAWIDQGAEWPDALANEIDLPAPSPKTLAMVDMLRTNNTANFMKAATAEPALLNERGPEGSTPFMYAVLYANTATLTQLLKMGADPNKHNDANATPLMWAVTNLEKTQLLLAHGAEVNARSDDLRTPLMIAARKPGNSATVELLLEHGANANPNSRPEDESSPLLDAVTAGDATTTELLLAHGADGKAAGELGLWMSVATSCDKCLAMLAPLVTSKDAYTAALGDIAVYGDLKAVQLMLDRGADVKAYDRLGRTALMYAAISDMLPLDEVKLLIDRGADVNAKSKHMNAGDEGESVLEMAKRNGETPVVKLLLASGAKPGGAMPALLTPRLKNDIRLAIQDSIPLLQTADANFSNKAGCVSCHNNSLTAMSVGLARKQGFRIDENTAAAQLKANVEALEKTRDRMHQGFLIPIGDHFSEGLISYILLGLHAEGYKADLNTDAAAMDIASRQRPTGEWAERTSDTRPPLCLDYTGETAMALRALQLYAPKTDAARYRKAIQMAAAWLAQAKSYSNDDRSWRVAGLAWSDTDKAATQTAMRELLATQKADGSWSDQPAMQSTAYATGKSLVALSIGGMAVSDPAYQRGVTWLLSHQEKDGSWYVQTRALAFQPFFDAGFPHGHDQWMSTAGTNWAVQALTLALPQAKNTMAAQVTTTRRVDGD